MCGIAGFCSPKGDYRTAYGKWQQIICNMRDVQKHRGMDDRGFYLGANCALSHARLAIIDPENGHQPMMAQVNGKKGIIVYNGELYNQRELKQSLEMEGVRFATNCDTEVVLLGCLVHGADFLKRMNGIFAFGIWEEKEKKLLLVRDCVGVKPLFFAKRKETLLFASEIKGLLAYPGMEPEADREGLCEIFGLGPARTAGKGVFRHVMELLPGEYLEYQDGYLRRHTYWKLESRPHEDSYEKTVEKTRELLISAVQDQMVSDVPVCTFLSGGIDSSLVTAICAEKSREKGNVLDTFSFDFAGNDENFRANEFQPARDRPFAERMVQYAHTHHRYLECTSADQYEYLFDAVRARDLPCMADVESSMVYFCSRVACYNKVTLTGECADEIFGGYPWFHNQECFRADTFPWSMDFTLRESVLKDEILRELPLREYVREAYCSSIAKTPVLIGESAADKRRREITWLNLTWFMQTLLERMDRASMYAGLEARVPLADQRILEYVWNVPWEMKCPDGRVKGLLRDAAAGLLPEEILNRKKCPYPKTYDPVYEKLLKKKLMETVRDPKEPLSELIDRTKLRNLLGTPSDYGKPFYGQLMAGPQFLAYLLQVNYWLKHYKIRLL
ncbi:MAG: asparagine synthase (glutamine-hydrolyzing) [Fusicatenibacter sp.]|nr:asparagine synthase (glutamine-hydrolyzing) [Lachnospiraceae bacterium]MDY2937186.1 asparagine synthase (glutamine-hydrolyzing) [Fusicatenibacter sp.]